MLLVGVRSYLKSVLRHRLLILDIHHPNSPYLREQGCPWLFYETKRGSRAKKVWENLVMVHGILQKVALRYQQMARQVTSLIQPYMLPAVSNVGRASSIGIATRKRLQGPGMKSR